MKPQDLTVALQTLLKQFPLLRLSPRERVDAPREGLSRKEEAPGEFPSTRQALQPLLQFLRK
jgi:hypothetical protein